MEKICGCKGCEAPVLALGLCNKHWQRTRKYGSPFALKGHNGLMKGLSAQERFNLQHMKSPNGCWLWTSAKDKDGYGRFHAVIGTASYRNAHRYSWAFHNQQEIPPGMAICHSCDTPACVNPEHLWLGSHAENHQDMVAKGRAASRRGAFNSQAVLVEGQVLKILADERPYSRIAADYGVTAMTISDIKNRHSWTHLSVDFIGRAQRVSPRRGKGNKLTAKDVRAIRSSKELGTVLAKRYSVSTSLICNIIKRRSWAHLN